MTVPDLSAWGDTPPEFVRLLAAEVAKSNRAQVAKMITQRLPVGQSVSRTSVSLLLANRYTSDNLAGMEDKIMAVLGRTVCPVLGEISGRECQKHRNAPFVATNPGRVQLYRACRTCPRNPDCEAQGDDHHG